MTAASVIALIKALGGGSGGGGGGGTGAEIVVPTFTATVGDPITATCDMEFSTVYAAVIEKKCFYAIVNVYDDGELTGVSTVYLDAIATSEGEEALMFKTLPSVGENLIQIIIDFDEYTIDIHQTVYPSS